MLMIIYLGTLQLFHYWSFELDFVVAVLRSLWSCRITDELIMSPSTGCTFNAWVYSCMYVSPCTWMTPIAINRPTLMQLLWHSTTQTKIAQLSLQCLDSALCGGYGGQHVWIQPIHLWDSYYLYSWRSVDLCFGINQGSLIINCLPRHAKGLANKAW